MGVGVGVAVGVGVGVGVGVAAGTVMLYVAAFPMPEELFGPFAVHAL